MFISEHFRRFVGILLAAEVAPHDDGPFNYGTRGNSVRFTEWNSVHMKYVWSAMNPVVLADYYPVITAVFPRSMRRFLLWTGLQFWFTGNSRRFLGLDEVPLSSSARNILTGFNGSGISVIELPPSLFVFGGLRGHKQQEGHTRNDRYA